MKKVLTELKKLAGIAAVALIAVTMALTGCKELTNKEVLPSNQMEVAKAPEHGTKPDTTAMVVSDAKEITVTNGIAAGPPSGGTGSGSGSGSTTHYPVGILNGSTAFGDVNVCQSTPFALWCGNVSLRYGPNSQPCAYSRIVASLQKLNNSTWSIVSTQSIPITTNHTKFDIAVSGIYRVWYIVGSEGNCDASKIENVYSKQFNVTITAPKYFALSPAFNVSKIPYQKNSYTEDWYESSGTKHVRKMSYLVIPTGPTEAGRINYFCQVKRSNGSVFSESWQRINVPNVGVGFVVTFISVRYKKWTGSWGSWSGDQDQNYTVLIGSNANCATTNTPNWVQTTQNLYSGW